MWYRNSNWILEFGNYQARTLLALYESLRFRCYLNLGMSIGFFDLFALYFMRDLAIVCCRRFLLKVFWFPLSGLSTSNSTSNFFVGQLFHEVFLPEWLLRALWIMCVESVEGVATKYTLHFMHISMFFMRNLILVLCYSLSPLSPKFTRNRAFNSSIS